MGRIPKAEKEKAFLNLGEERSFDTKEDTRPLFVQEAFHVYLNHLLNKMKGMNFLENLNSEKENQLNFSYKDALEGILKFAQNNVIEMNELLVQMPLIKEIICSQRDYSIIIKQHLLEYYLVSIEIRIDFRLFNYFILRYFLLNFI
jgi:hypothetical protein